MPPFTSTPRLALTAAGLLLFALAGCAGSSAPGSQSTVPPGSSAMSGMSGAPSTVAGSSATGSQIVLDNFAYSPMTLTVRPGQKVSVVNHDTTAHTLTADDKSFDTGTIAPGKTGTFTAPTKPGSYSYICTIHQFMHGTVTVR